MKPHEAASGADWQKHARKRLLPYLLLACLMTLAARTLHTSHWRWADFLDLLVLDQCFEIRGPLDAKTVSTELAHTSNFYLIEIPYNLPRPLLVQLIERLKQAKVIALDLMLVDQQAQLSEAETQYYRRDIVRWQQETEQLAKALGQAKNVVVGVWPETQRSTQPGAAGKAQLQRIWQKPAPEILKTARYHSHLWVQPSPQDGIARHVELFEDIQSAPNAPPERVPAFSLAIAAAALDVSPGQLNNLQIQNGTLSLGKHRLALANDDTMIIDYLGPRECFGNNDISIRYNVVLELYEEAEFADKIVFIGGTDFKSKDEFTTPFGDMPGVHVHMHAAATLLGAQGPPRVWPLWQTTLLALLSSVLLIFPLLRFSLWASFLAAVLLCIGIILGCAWLFAHKHAFFYVSVPIMAVVLTYNSIAVYRYGQARAALARFVGKDIASVLLNPLQTPSLGGHTEIATAFFCDLRKFSTASERLTPQETEPLINAYTNKVTEITRRFGGLTIDYFGDGVFVLFRQAQAGPDHALKAMQSALALQAELQPIVQNLCERSGVDLQVAIGIHSGAMHVGVIGSEEHMKMGALGDAVNVASRVQGMTTRCGYPIVVTRESYDLFRDRLPLTPCGHHEIRGRTQDVELFGAGKPLTVSETLLHNPLSKSAKESTTEMGATF